MNVDLKLKGKNVLLFGGHSSIGREVSYAFSKEGAGVTIACRDTETGRRVAEKCLEMGAKWAETVECDGTSYEDTEKAVAAALLHGDLDVVYHGIGFGHLGHFLDETNEDWDQIYQAVLKSVMNAWHIALPHMVKAQHGCFVNLASTMGRGHSVMEPVYGCMKSALIHLAQTLAIEVGRAGVRINVVAPGPTRPTCPPDEMSKGSNWLHFGTKPEILEEVKAESASQIALYKDGVVQKGIPLDQAYAVLYLASEVTGRHLTGQIIGPDGGQYLSK